MRASTISILALLGACVPAQAQSLNVVGSSTLNLTVNPSSPGITIPTYFVGLSFELNSIFGTAPQLINNTPLTNLLSVLGGNCTFRVGGNTSDTATPPLTNFSTALQVGTTICGSNYQIWGQAWQPISPNTTQSQQGSTDAGQVSQLLGTAGAPIIYNVIGNEPNFYSSFTETFAAYQTGWNIIQPLITSANASAKYAGPDVATATRFPPDWVFQFSDQTSGMGSIASMLTLHCYGVGQTGDLLADLTNSFRYDECPFDARAVAQNPNNKALAVPFVVSETGSLLGNGSGGKTLGAALYDLRNMILFAENGWASMNFHGSPAIAAPSYSPVGTIDGSTYFAQATLYAMLAFQQLTGGRVLPLKGLKDGVALAVLKSGQTKVLVTNQDLTNPVIVNLTTTGSPTIASVIYMSGVSYADTNVTLGNAAVSSSGAFSPSPTSLQIASKTVSFFLCASCAAIVTLQ